MLLIVVATVILSMVSSLKTLKTVLITGSTDGIGLHTAKKLLNTGDFRVLVHGRSATRVQNTVAELRSFEAGQEDKVLGFTRDISTKRGAMGLANDVKSALDAIDDFDGKLDVLINNAGVFEEQMTLTEENLELTFAVNVQAPFIITRELLPLLIHGKSRIINISSISQSDGPNTVDFENLQFQKGGWSSYASYGMSKRLMAMFSLELANRVTEEAGVNAPLVVSCDPGTVNTKMLLAGWGACGIDVTSANNEFNLATKDDVQHGEYYVGPRPSIPHKDVKVEANRKKLWSILQDLAAS